MQATLKAELKPTDTLDMLAPPHLLHDGEALLTLLAIGRHFYPLGRATFQFHFMLELTAVEAVLHLTMITNIEMLLPRDRFNKLSNLAPFTLLNIHHSLVITEHSADNLLDLRTHNMKNTVIRMIDDLLTIFLRASHDLVLINLFLHMLDQTFLAKCMLTSH